MIFFLNITKNKDAIIIIMIIIIMIIIIMDDMTCFWECKSRSRDKSIMKNNVNFFSIIRTMKIFWNELIL